MHNSSQFCTCANRNPTLLYHAPSLRQSSTYRTYLAKCDQCQVAFSQPTQDLESFLHYLLIGTAFRQHKNRWTCGHCHSSDTIAITSRHSYQLVPGISPSWVIIDTRGHWEIFMYYQRSVGNMSAEQWAKDRTQSLNTEEGRERWMAVPTGVIPKYI